MSPQIVERMAVEVAGNGEPVILVHGLGGTANTFEPQMEVLRSHRAIRIDLPGSGRSRTPDGDLSIDGFAEALVRLAGVLGAQRAHFVGHSLGTIVCQHIAVNEPRLVRSLVLLGALTEPPEAARGALRDRAKKVRVEGMDDVAETIKNGSTAGQTKRDNPAAAAFVRESILRQDPEGYAKTCEALAAAKAADAARIACPTLLITGDEDPVAPASVARQLGDRLDHAEVTILSRCGHWPGIEQPQAVNDAMRRFYAAAARTGSG